MLDQIQMDLRFLCCAFFLHHTHLTRKLFVIVFCDNGCCDSFGWQTYGVWSCGAWHGRCARNRKSSLRQERQTLRRRQNRVCQRRINKSKTPHIHSFALTVNLWQSSEPFLWFFDRPHCIVVFKCCVTPTNDVCPSRTTHAGQMFHIDRHVPIAATWIGECMPHSISL
jgi:hypothetical protein